MWKCLYCTKLAGVAPRTPVVKDPAQTATPKCCRFSSSSTGGNLRSIGAGLVGKINRDAREAGNYASLASGALLTSAFPGPSSSALVILVLHEMRALEKKRNTRILCFRAIYQQL